MHLPTDTLHDPILRMCHTIIFAYCIFKYVEGLHIQSYSNILMNIYNGLRVHPPGEIVFANNNVIYYLRPLVTISISLRKVHWLKVLIIFNYIGALLFFVFYTCAKNIVVLIIWFQEKLIQNWILLFHSQFIWNNPSPISRTTSTRAIIFSISLHWF